MTWGLLQRLFGSASEGPVVGSIDFPRKIQWDWHSCGVRCVLGITEFYGIKTDFDEVADEVNLTRARGTQEGPIVRFLRRRGLHTVSHDWMSEEHLASVLSRGSVVLVDMDGDHWAVVHAMSATHVWVADPSLRRQLGRYVTREQFRERWTGLGIAIRPHRRR